MISCLSEKRHDLFENEARSLHITGTTVPITSSLQYGLNDLD
jgi:hypothetical protein